MAEALKLVSREMGKKSVIDGGKVIPLLPEYEWLRHQVGIMEKKTIITKTGQQKEVPVFHLVGWGPIPAKADLMANRHPLVRKAEKAATKVEKVNKLVQLTQ